MVAMSWEQLGFEDSYDRELRCWFTFGISSSSLANTVYQSGYQQVGRSAVAGLVGPATSEFQ
jgi:hypothetical protein